MAMLHSAGHDTFCRSHYILQVTLHSAGHITFCKSRYILHGHVTFCMTTLHSAGHVTFCRSHYILQFTLHSAGHVTFCMATLHSAFCKASTLHPPQQHNSVCHNQPIAMSTTCVRTCEESLDIDKISMTL